MGDAGFILLLGLVSSELLLSHLIGVCPLLAVSKKLETAAGLACALIIVQPLALGLFLILRTFLPADVSQPEIALPLIVLCNIGVVHTLTVFGQIWPNRIFNVARPFMSVLNINCVVLAVTLISLERTQHIIYALGLTIGYAISLLVIAELRERLIASNVPRFMQGAPIVLLSMGIVSLAIEGILG